MSVEGYAEVRLRLGMPIMPKGRMRMDLIRAPKPEPRRETIRVLPNYAPFNFYSRPSTETIIRLVGLKHGFKYHDILGTGRSYPLVAARREAARLVATHCRAMSLVQIGRIFHKNHATIINLLRPKRQSKNQIPGTQDGMPKQAAATFSPTINSIHRDGNETGVASRETPFAS